MRKNEIGDAGKLAIGKALLASESSKLHTMHCDEWSIDPSITELDLSGKKLKAADATFLAGIIRFSSTLKRLKINADLDIEALKTTASVDLSNKGLKAEDAIIVAACIQMDG